MHYAAPLALIALSLLTGCATTPPASEPQINLQRPSECLSACPQLPTTLPTLDEILTLEPSYTAEQAADRLLQLSSAIAGDHVFTLRAELEGMKYPGILERLITGWKNKGFELVALRDMRSGLDIGNLPRHSVIFTPSPGRIGPRMTQGPLFLHE